MEGVRDKSVRGKRNLCRVSADEVRAKRWRRGDKVFDAVRTDGVAEGFLVGHRVRDPAAALPGDGSSLEQQHLVHCPLPPFGCESPPTVFKERALL